MKHAKKSLQEAAEDRIRDGFDRALGPNARVLWWDDGGYLETVIEEACSEVGVNMTKAEGSPLSLRKHALMEGDDPVLWYVPESKKGRDWFRDVRKTGDEIECSIEELAAKVYDVNTWDIPEPGSAEGGREELAEVLLGELNKETRRPSLQGLQDILILGGHGNPLKRVLQGGWSPDEAREDSVDALRERLKEEGIPVLEEGDGAHEVVEKVRRWAVAQSLIEAGAPPEAFPAPYDSEPSSSGRGAQIVLAEVLKDGSPTERAESYLASYWEEAVNRIEAPWEVAECPVDGALENALWEGWLSVWDDGDYETCLEQAGRRADVLEEAYRIAPSKSRESTPWSKAWRQAEDLADLASRLDVFRTKELGELPVHKLYGDEEKGTWKIDRDVRKLIVTGSPEKELPESHPGRERLEDIRSDLVNTQYLDYLQTLAEETTTQIRSEEVIDGLQPVRQFWHDNRKEFAKGPETVIFYIDALRLDLAYELAEKLRSKDYQVKSTLRAGILPSETEFGMGALTPGDPHTFEVDLVDGKLRALRNRKKVDTSKREKLLKREGWSIAKGTETGWEKPRVAYFDTEIDDIGESDLDKIEEKLSRRVEDLADLIADQIERGKWERSFVVADHGFVLLPKGTPFEKIGTPDNASESKRRWAAGKNLSNGDTGVVLDGQTALTAHLSTPVRVLVDPLQRFRGKGITDNRFYHGGALPQEFILNFLRIDRK